MMNFQQNLKSVTQQNSLHLLPELKIQEDQTHTKSLFQESSRIQVQNSQTNQTPRIHHVQPINPIRISPISPSKINLVIQKSSIQISPLTNKIVEENGTKQNSKYLQQNNQFLSSNWLLLRHPNSLFKIIQPKQKNLTKKQYKNFIPLINPSGQNTATILKQEQNKLPQIKYDKENQSQKEQAKTKQIQKNPNKKSRRGKNKQPMAQKFIKKLSGFHYTKNYKQNRNKTLKKLVKRGLAINLENVTTFIRKLKLQINKKYLKSDLKVKKNKKGQEIDPKKFYDLYHSHFSFAIQRQFVERFYNQVFKRVYVIMWKSDERLKRVDSIKIQGVHYNTPETEAFSEVKIQHKQIEQQKQHITESKPQDKRAAFVQCLDQQGKRELQDVFDQEYNKLYEEFNWSIREQNFTIPQKENLKKRIQKFSWIDD